MKKYIFCLLILIIAVPVLANPKKPVNEARLRALINTKCRTAAKKAALQAFVSDYEGRRYGGVEAEVADPGQYMVTILQDSDEGDETYSVETEVRGVKNLKNGTYDVSRFRCVATSVDHLE